MDYCRYFCLAKDRYLSPNLIDLPLTRCLYLIYLFVFVQAGLFPVFGQTLSLSKSDTITVQLFSDKNPKSLYLRAEGGDIILIASGNRFVLSPGDGEIRVYINHAFIVVNHPKGAFRTKRLFIRHQPDTFTMLFHPELERRYYAGDLFLSANGSFIEVRNTVGLEDYIASVVAGEMPFENPEALKAQAVIARTYALWSLAKSKNQNFILRDDTFSQVYRGEALNKPRYRKAAESTMGEVLTWSHKLILAVYHSTSGGSTTGNHHVWSGRALPYLSGVIDHEASQKSPHFKWEFSVSNDELNAIFGRASFQQEIKITERDESGRVLLIRKGSSVISGSSFRSQMIRRFGIRSIKSTLFDVRKDGDAWLFYGQGLGHGVGLSQWGALGLVESGWSYRDVLRFYYSGTEIQNIHFLEEDIISLAE